MRLKQPVIVLSIILYAAAFLSSKSFAEDTDTTISSRIEDIVIIPFSNPLQGFDANLMAWNTSTKLLVSGGGWFGEKLDLSESRKGRCLQIAITAYLNSATSYYSHEIAHQFLEEKHSFKVDFTDWYPQLIPAFEFSDDFSYLWDDYELELDAHSDKFRQNIHKYIRLNEAGLYQEAFNARHSALESYLSCKATFSNAISNLTNRLSTQQYLLFHRNDPCEKIIISGKTFCDHNDITAYIHNMEELGILISPDDWFLCSTAAFLASGQTWNSTRAILSYLASGKESVNNFSLSLNNRFAVSPPNFYIFSTIRGLYLETEFFILSKKDDGDMVRMGIGTGLDSFGFRRTGPTDWLRFGGKYYSFQIGIPYSALEFSPFCYFDFDSGLRHRGQSFGIDVRAKLRRRLYLYTRFEHDTNDMEEQLIKNKDEGLNIFGALEIEM